MTATREGIDLLRKKVDQGGLKANGAVHPGDSATGKDKIGYSFEHALSLPLTTEYFVKGFISPREITVIFGESGALKSFVCTDVGLHVASNKQWCYRHTKHVGVLFILGEGAAGYAKRLRAWALHHGVDPRTVKAYVYPQPVNLHAGPHEMQPAIREAECAMGVPVGLVVIDTYSTNLGDADEHLNSEAATVLRHIREAAGATRGVLLVHHVGHGDKQRERGAYQLRANADARFLVQRDDNNHGEIVTLKNEKQKDNAELAPMRLEWNIVELGTDCDGDPITSLVLTPTDRTPVEAQRECVRIGSRETGSLGILWRLSGPNGSSVRSDDWRTALVRAGTLDAKAGDQAQRRSFNRITKALKDGALINQLGSGKSTCYSPRSTDVVPQGFAT